jgi:hypothetical protein
MYQRLLVQYQQVNLQCLCHLRLGSTCRANSFGFSTLIIPSTTAPSLPNALVLVQDLFYLMDAVRYRFPPKLTVNSSTASNYLRKQLHL